MPVKLHSFHSLLLLALLFLVCIVLILPTLPSVQASSPPTPTYDPLATPVLPENPSAQDIGKHVYYYHCMPCHGDQGQGLTDAFRAIWEEDHQNCWGRGCHGGRERDEGFPIPTVIPAVILEGDALQRFASQDELVAYLELTHPPQEPGRLAVTDYESVVAFLWTANHKPAVANKPTSSPTALVEPTRLPTQPLPSETPASTTPSETLASKPPSLTICGQPVAFLLALLAALAARRPKH
jgi:hypothetical protein